MTNQFFQTLRPLRKVGKLRGVISIPSFAAIDTAPDPVSFFGQYSYWTNVNLGAVELFDGTGLTLECWVKVPPGIVANEFQLIQIANHQLRIQADMTVRGIVGNTVPATFVVDSTGTINRNEWNHVAVTCDGTEVKLYVNFQLVDTIAFTGTINTSAGRTVDIQDTSNTNDCGLIMNEVRVWNYARSIDELLFAGYTPRDITGAIDTGLNAYFPLNEGTGDTIDNLIAAKAFTLTLTDYNINNAAWLDDDAYPYNLGASWVVGEFTLDLSGRSLSFVYPVRKPYTGVNFVPCIRWVNDDGEVERYSLWSDSTGGFDVAPVVSAYTGQVIPDGAVIEIWNVVGVGERNVELTEGFDIETSLLNSVTDPNTTTQTQSATALTAPNEDIYSTAFPLDFPITFTEPSNNY